MFFAGETRTGLFPNMPLGGFDVETRDLFDSRGSVLALDFSAGTASLAVPIGSLSVPTRMTEYTGGFSYMYEFLPGWVRPYVGARLSVVAVDRNLSAAGVPSQNLFTMAPGLVAGVNFEVAPHFGIGLRARASYLLYETDDNLSLGYADAGLQLRWEL